MAIHPTLGRFLQRDPVEYEDSLNLYEYVKSNPLKYVDSDGRQAATTQPSSGPLHLAPGQTYTRTYPNGGTASFTAGPVVAPGTGTGAAGITGDNGYGSGRYFQQLKAIRDAAQQGRICPTDAEIQITLLRVRRNEMWQQIGSVPGNAPAQAQIVQQFFNPGPVVARVNGSGPSLGDEIVSTLGRLWNSPNSLIGLAFGLAGIPFGTRIHIVNGSVEVTNHPFGTWIGLEGAVTVGHVEIYTQRVSPGQLIGWPQPGVTFRQHESAHVPQGDVLGPLYLPVHIISKITGFIIDGTFHGPHDFMEQGPGSTPPRPW